MNGFADASRIEALYGDIIAAWNSADAARFANSFAADGNVIGYDGSPVNGRREVLDHLTAIFRDHKPGRFVTITREVRALSADTAMLRAVVGIVPDGKTEIEPKVNFLQTLVAAKEAGAWRAALLQATPAQFHGRPEMSEQLTQELRAAAAKG